MTDIFSKVIRQARLVRKAAEFLVLNGETGSSTDVTWWTLKGCCADVSAAIAYRCGVESWFECGFYTKGGHDWPHSWLRSDDGRVIDATATQFGIERKIYVPRGRERLRYETVDRGNLAPENGENDVYLDFRWIEQVNETISRLRKAHRRFKVIK